MLMTERRKRGGEREAKERECRNRLSEDSPSLAVEVEATLSFHVEVTSSLRQRNNMAAGLHKTVHHSPPLITIDHHLNRQQQ